MSPDFAHSNRASAPVLRPYQSAAIAATLTELLQVRSTLLVQATGTGKTIEFAELARIEVSHGGRVLILVHRDELIKQARRKCEAVGLWPDVEKGKLRANTLAKVVLASVQSLRGKRLLRWARRHFTLVIVDEAHHAAAKSYRDILDYFDEAKVVGVTATPDRGDGQALSELFSTVAYRYDIKQAIDEQYLVPIVARRVVVESVNLDSVAVRAGDFAQDQLASVMADERALQGVAVPLLELAGERQTIGFCVDVAHATKMAAVVNSYRPGSARMVSGETDDDEREAMLDAFARRDFQFLFNCDVLTEGFDAPACACVAMIRPTKSRGRYVQCGGRGLRLLGDTLDESRRNGKANCLIVDFSGTAGKHSLMGPADCLAGAGEIDDDVRAELERRLETAQLEIGSVMRQAEDEVAKRRAALKLSAVVRYYSEHVDPFIGEAASGPALPSGSDVWHRESASQAQLKALEDDGITLSKLPPGFSRADAWNLLARIRSRARAGLCSYKAARKLAQAGVRNTDALGHERAKVLLDKLREGNWRPSALANEPEVRAARDPFPLRREGVA